MALRYEWSWGIAANGGFAVYVDDGTPQEVRFASSPSSTARYTHSDISTVDSGYTKFATAFQTALNAAGLARTDYVVAWNGPTGYTISAGGNFSLSFTTGVTSSAEGTHMRRILGFSGDQPSASSHSSNVRPYYLVIPAAQGRTQYTRDYETPDVVDGAMADDGSDVFIAKNAARKVGEWVQTAEIETVPANFEDAGTPTHADMVDAGTSADDVPWSWEHAFLHSRTGQHRISVHEASDHEVWSMRPDGMAFHPQRWSGTDQPIWQIPMRCYLIGRV